MKHTISGTLTEYQERGLAYARSLDMGILALATNDDEALFLLGAHLCNEYAAQVSVSDVRELTEALQAADTAGKEALLAQARAIKVSAEAVPVSPFDLVVDPIDR